MLHMVTLQHKQVKCQKRHLKNKYPLNWLCKHVEKIKSSQDFISSNSCAELSFSRVSIVK